MVYACIFRLFWSSFFKFLSRILVIFFPIKLYYQDASDCGVLTSNIKSFSSVLLVIGILVGSKTEEKLSNVIFPCFIWQETEAYFSVYIDVRMNR